MRRRLLVPFVLGLVAASGCEGESRWPGAFESAAPVAGAGGPFAPGAGEGDDDVDGDRAVVEADIFRFAGGRLYVLNQYRGLYVFDVGDPDHPVELGRAPITGYPIEMYVRDGVVHVIVSDYFDYVRPPGAGGALEAVHGSRVVTFDLADPAAPVLLGDVVLDGWVADTRLVGDVIYAAANRYGPWVPGVPDGEAADATVVTAIDVGGGAPVLVERLELAGAASVVQASAEAFVIAGERWDGAGVATELTWVDITSAAGVLRERAHVRLAGQLREDTALDLRGDQLRVLTRAWETGLTKLWILDATRPDTLPVVGTLDYFYDGSLFGTAFDADRLYMVHYQRIDPLEIVDLSDPARPVVTGILEMPGWIERIAPLGDRLVGLGVDDTAGSRISLSLFDVADPYAPALLDRIVSGSDWSWSTALWERKAWLVDADAGLILFPYSGWSDGATVYRHALGVVELGRDALVPRGEVQAPAPVERGALHEGRVYAISVAALQVVDVRDLDAPVPTATIELARDLLAYRRTAAVGVELARASVDGWAGSASPMVLRTTPLAAPDGRSELGRVTLPRAASALVVDGELAIAVRASDGCWPGVDQGDAFSGCGESSPAGISVVDLAAPAAPVVTADLDFPTPAPLPVDVADRATRWSYWLAGYGAPIAGGAGEPALALGAGRFGWIRVTTISCHDALACLTLGIVPESVGPDWVYGWRAESALVVLDLRAGGGPAFLAEVPLGEGVVEAAFAREDLVAASVPRRSRVDADGRVYVRYDLERVVVAGGARVRLAPVNVPGVTAWLDDDGTRALTLDRQYVTPEGWPGWGTELTLCAVELAGGGAVLTSRLALGSEIASVAAAADLVYAVRAPAAWAEPVPGAGGEAWTAPGSQLLAIDARDRDDLRLAGEQELGGGYWWIALRTETTLVLGGGAGGLALFSLAPDPASPGFLRFVRTMGWMSSLFEADGLIYVVAGPYGLQVVPVAEAGPR